MRNLSEKYLKKKWKEKKNYLNFKKIKYIIPINYALHSFIGGYIGCLSVITWMFVFVKKNIVRFKKKIKKQKQKKILKKNNNFLTCKIDYKELSKFRMKLRLNVHHFAIANFQNVLICRRIYAKIKTVTFKHRFCF